jgi:hypothetical protein
MAERTWKCQHTDKGVKCGHINPKRKQLCEKCRKRRPATKTPAHKRVLEVFPKEAWITFFGNECGICGRKETPDAPLVRDHEHRVVPGNQGGGMRGLLCFLCNKQLPYWAKLEWMEKAAAYLHSYEDGRSTR